MSNKLDRFRGWFGRHGASLRDAQSASAPSAKIESVRAICEHLRPL